MAEITTYKSIKTQKPKHYSEICKKQNKQQTGVIINDLMYLVAHDHFFFFVFFVIDLDYLNHILNNGRLFISNSNDHSKILSADKLVLVFLDILFE